MDEHYHCRICEEPYPTRAEADACFERHNEIEHLRWVAREVIYMKSYMYDLMDKIDFIDKKYGIDE